MGVGKAGESEVPAAVEDCLVMWAKVVGTGYFYCEAGQTGGELGRSTPEGLLSVGVLVSGPSDCTR